MGFDFSIEYKPGISNQVADALSRINEEEVVDHDLVPQFMALVSFPISEFLLELKKENNELSEYQHLHDKFGEGKLSPAFSVNNGIILYKGRYFLSPTSPLREVVMKEFHATKIGGHVGIKRTFVRIAARFFGKRCERILSILLSHA